ncbi:hypothetical protein V8E36_001551 [Tilletia maclaganii]
MSTELKNIVIVGASVAGANAARALSKSLPATHRVVLIEANEEAYYPIAALRAAVVPGYEKNVFEPLKTFFGQPDKTRHIVRAGTRVTEITNTDVAVKALSGEEERIPFEYAILATGSKYGAPARAASPKADEARAALVKLQEQIAASKNVLIIGGGEVGVEFAGEIRAQYWHPEEQKKITIVSRGEQLIAKDTPLKLHNKLHSQLKSLDVTVLLGDSVELGDDENKTGPLVEARTYTTKNGTTIADVDFVVLAVGTKPDAELFAKADAAGVVDGQVAVDPKTLRVKSTVLTNWFAAGDVTNAPGNKTWVNGESGGQVAAANVLSLVKGGNGDAKSFGPMNVTVVPLGPNKGASSLFGWVFGEWITAIVKSRTLFVFKFRALFKA